MKLKFKNQDFQTDAVNSVVDLFTGMAKGVNMFLVDDGAQVAFTGDLGEGNAIVVDDDMLLQNMHAVQKRNNLPLTDANWIGPNLIPDAEPLEYRERTFPQFSIEMETGTGKTYVYTKTIFELNRKYGLTKFIIVVPSVAIREGVYKSFEVTKEHFGLVCYHKFYLSVCSIWFLRSDWTGPLRPSRLYRYDQMSRKYIPQVYQHTF